MRIKLKSFQWMELRDKQVETKLKSLSIDDFNLLISDNAQGKTRLFRTLNFFSSLFKDKPQIIKTDFSGKFNFEIVNSKEVEKVVYEIKIMPENGKNNFNETVTRNNQVLFSSKKKKYASSNKPTSSMALFRIIKQAPMHESTSIGALRTLLLLGNFHGRRNWRSVSLHKKDRRVGKFAKEFCFEPSLFNN